jgi:hypothetical protein
MVVVKIDRRGGHETFVFFIPLMMLHDFLMLLSVSTAANQNS